MSEDVTLKDLLDSRLQALESGVYARLKSMQTSIDKAERILDVRLESMNEFRAALKDQAANFVSRESIEHLEHRIRNLEGHRSYTLGIAAVLVILISVAMKMFG